MMDPRLVIEALRAILRRWKLITAVLLLAVILYQAEVTEGLRDTVALRDAAIVAKVERIDALDLEISVMQFSIDQLRQDGERRQQAAARAVAVATEQSRQQEAEIRRLRQAKPATGNDCQDTMTLLNDYRSRQ